MKERLFRANGHENERSGREAFDFVSEGARCGLAPDVSLTLWDHARREATDHYGWCDPVRAREIFLEKARRTGQGGLSGAVPGKTTLVLGGKSAAGHPDPGRTSLIIEQARRGRKGAYTPEESLGLFQTAMTGSRAGLVKLARAIVAVDYGAALQASAKLRQDLASARAHLANGHADNERLRIEFLELEGPVNNLLAKTPVMSRGVIDAARGPRGSWAQWDQEIANGRAVLAVDTEMREFARAIELAAVVAPPAMSVELATAVSSSELGRSSTAPHTPSPPLDPDHADAHGPLGEPKIDKKGADPRKQARRGEPSRWPPLLSPGKRALTDGMGGVQMKRTPGSAASTDAVHDAAARGVLTTTTALPFGERIQESFGPEHDISKIVAHIGSDAPRAMGAEAFAFGSHVVFGAPPDLHTAAHEAAHVIQQAHGVNLHGGVGEAGDAYERQADAVADRVVAGLSAADLFGSATRSATSQSAAVQMKQAAHTPAKQCDFVIPLPQDSFTVSFELLSAGAGDVRVVIAPANFSRAYQSEMKYWDVKGREVDKDDSYVSMGNWSVPAQPHQQMTRIATPAKFDPIDLKRLSEPSGTVWTFDLDGDGKPDFAVRIDFKIGNIFREYSFTATNNQSVEKFGFHFVQDDAYKYGYQGNSAPRRQKDDFVDALTGIIHALAPARSGNGLEQVDERHRRPEAPLRRDRYCPILHEVASPKMKGKLSAKLRSPQQSYGPPPHRSASRVERQLPGPWTRRLAISDHTACHGWLELR